MRIDSIRIFVKDFHNSRIFYEKALGLECVADGEDQGYLVYRPGDINLILETVDMSSTEEADLVGRFTGYSLHTENLNQTCDTLRAFDPDCIVAEPTEQDWGGNMAHVSDPSGNILTFVEY
ncbi:VOC family protein [Poriferisphaera corsica]|uniref:VOC family protein n=1 Tax=Poriferisphaera corsica TaxID=2528020 RepID=UPI0011A53E34|nr:VOC family protein [Poriferisphaera corsica]